MTITSVTMPPSQAYSEATVGTNIQISSPLSFYISGHVAETKLPIEVGGGFYSNAGYPAQRIYSEEAGSELGDTVRASIAAAPAERMYPHVFDASTNAGKVLNLLNTALQELDKAIEAIGEPDLASVISHLTNISAILNSSYSLIDFNRELRPLVAYIKRATLITTDEGITRSSLNTLSSVLNTIVENPLLSLNEASDLTERLSQEGWQGEVEAISRLIQALLDEGELEEAQIELFR